MTKWLAEAAASIPLRALPLSQRLWEQGRLKYMNGDSKVDLIDSSNAHLVASTVERGKQLLVLLPDEAARRAPLLFASALLTYWWDQKARGLASGRVAYVGSTVGIRSHLGQTVIDGLRLDTVFPQLQARSKSGVDPSHPKLRFFRSSSDGVAMDGLPEVISIYSPADPVRILQACKARWLAIDCGGAAELRWLPFVLEYARSHKMPLIAWGTNPLSGVAKAFEESGVEVFRWPYSVDSDIPMVQVHPVIIEDGAAVSTPLRAAFVALARASLGSVSGRLAQDAIQVTWRLQRALETLPVPLDLYEAEVSNYWGMTSIARLLEAVRRFIDALPQTDSSLKSRLAEVLSNQEIAVSALRHYDPPLWSALTQLCVEESIDGEERPFVFSSRARKQLFSLALLARFNITTDDLRDVRRKAKWVSQ